MPMSIVEQLSLSQLKPGDCILYKPSSVFGFLISVKTWHKISHIEIYAGSGEVVASRDGKGVDIYPLRTDHIHEILRPTVNFYMYDALKWFVKRARGQKYDWLGLLRFSWGTSYLPDSITSNRMFCSEFATRFYRAGGLDPFPNEDADAVAPFQFSSNPLFKAFSLIYPPEL